MQGLKMIQRACHSRRSGAQRLVLMPSMMTHRCGRNLTSTSIRKMPKMNQKTTVMRSHAIHHPTRRLASTATLPQSAKAVTFQRYGAPSRVLKVEEQPLGTVQGSQIGVKFLAAPINPSDLNVIAGNYGTSKSLSELKLPAVGGNEGVAQVISVGNQVQNVKVGDRVIPARMGLGTWRNYGIFEGKDFHKIPEDISTENACTMAISSASALRMLEDFVSLKTDDVIIQNGANSATGLAVTSLAAAKGIRIINVIREGRQDQDHNNLHGRMKDMGAYLVVTDRYLKTPQFRRLISDLPAPKLALNSVGGDSATEMARVLAPGGTLVTYGGMSFKPVTIPTSLFVFKDLHLRGFWLTKWLEENDEKKKLEMYNTLYGHMRNEQLAPWIESWDFNQFENAFARASEPFRDRKIVLTVRD